MQRLTDQGWQKINELSQRYGVSTDAVMSMLQSVVNGGGTMAQFYIQELGGGGQWMQGGMTMVGDMFNYGLKSKVDNLCTELSQLLAQQPFVPTPPVSNQSQWQGGGQQQSGSGSGFSLFVPGQGGYSGNWWPAELGSPNGSGGQNNVRYAYFSNSRRLAVDINGQVTVYDTLDNNIGGVSQQQSGDGSLTFTSQYGTINVSSLPVISVNGVPPTSQSSNSSYSPPPAPQYTPPTSISNQSASNQSTGSSYQEADIFGKIERLADLNAKGILSNEEFAAKKSELLSRL
ncbi:hypothetical protein ETAA8_37760 [Anatilimnocola aggregata]|uniref:SHOCT domain-containing protein n=1 Tax=Anatilimnocola aggregata TaxID=2528021 RepID=A0A517YEL9_9BACT|nr:SHOCT domain-containing protein [Anatilimnocola aggregata]QDU28673.1 hypothetical protein ETAA8_37760 [Anatilimnocola aggregata]